MTQESNNMSAPERIWAFPTHIDKTHGYFTPEKTYDVEVEYVRADLCTPADERVKPLEWFEGAADGIFADQVWSADAYLIEKRKNVDNAFDLHCYFWDGDNARRYPTLEAAKAAAQADYEARILAALEPAPDHSDWNAAIEAAAVVALDQEVVCSEWFMQTGQHCNVYEQLPIVAERIRALKKGPDHE